MARKVDPRQARAAALAIVRRLRDVGHTAYFAGGCVRDELLNLSPTDYDVATDATPDRIRACFRRTAEVGAAFGVILVTPQQDEGAPEPVTVEVATFRADGPYTDRRRPDVIRFSDPASDAHRRDFTINALFLDPLPADDSTSSRIIDFVGGREDLQKRLIRAVGDPDARLAEDHLRALRAVRLAARLGFEIEPRTAAAIRQHAGELQGISRERIGEEVRRMLSHPSRARAVELLEALSLDVPILGPADRAIAPAGHKLLRGLAPDASFPTCLAAWALERPSPDPAPSGHDPSPRIRSTVQHWRDALCLSNDDRDAMLAILSSLAAFEGPWESLSVARQKRLAGATGPGPVEALAILAIRNPALATRITRRIDDLAHTPSGVRPVPLLTGDDLVAMGYSPGPGFKGTLDRVYDAQLEDRVSTREEAMELARTLGV